MKLLLFFTQVLLLSRALFAVYNDYYADLEKKILSQNPNIIMQKYISLSAKSKQLGDFLLPDTTLSYTLMQHGHRISISQLIPFPTKMIANSKQLNNNYKVSQEEYESVKVQIISEFKFHYIGLYFLESKIQILNNNLFIIEQIESQINSQVVSGRIPTDRLLSIQIEKEKLKDTVQRTITQKNNAVENILSLFENEIKIESLLQSIKKIYLPQYRVTLSDLDIKTLAIASAIYRKKYYEKEQIKYLKQLKWNKFIPDLTLRGSYAQLYNPNNASDISRILFFSNNFQLAFSLQVPITVFKRVGELSEVNNVYKAQNYELKNTYNILSKNIKIASENYLMNQKSYNAYKTTLKETAEQSFTQMQSKYITSENISAVDFLEAFRRLLDIDLMILTYQVEMEKNLIILQRITTKNISELLIYIKD